MEDTTTSFHPTDYLKLLAIALILIPITFLLYTAWMANLSAQKMLYSGCRGDLESLESAGYPSEAVTITSRDGLQLDGWFSRGRLHPDIAIVVMPGQGSNTCYALPEAEMMAAAGYSTLIFEHRTCEDPMLPRAIGVGESRDLLGAVDYLEAQPGIEHVGVLGFTEGGVASILAAAQDTRIEAVVSVGSYASLEDEILEPQSSPNWYESLKRHFILWFIQQEGINPDEARPVDVVQNISPRPLLLVYGGCDEAAGRKLAAAADPATSEFWLVPEGGHGGLAQFDADAYRERIVPFFDEAFGLTQARH